MKEITKKILPKYFNFDPIASVWIDEEEGEENNEN